MTEEIWRKQPRETGKAYKAFVAYLEIRTRRTIAQAYRNAKGKPGARVPAYFYNWSHRYEWIERADAYDAADLEAKLAEGQKARARARARFVDNAEILASRAILIAMGKSSASKGQVMMLRDALDRAGLAAPKETRFGTIEDRGPTTITVKIGETE